MNILITPLDFRKIILMLISVFSSNVSYAQVKTDWSTCSMSQPIMPNSARRYGIEDQVKAELTMINGVARSVKILSGDAVFHESVKSAMMKYRCPNVPGTEVVSQVFNFEIEQTDAERSQGKEDRERAIAAAKIDRERAIAAAKKSRDEQLWLATAEGRKFTAESSKKAALQKVREEQCEHAIKKQYEWSSKNKYNGAIETQRVMFRYPDHYGTNTRDYGTNFFSLYRIELKKSTANVNENAMEFSTQVALDCITHPTTAKVIGLERRIN